MEFLQNNIDKNMLVRKLVCLLLARYGTPLVPKKKTFINKNLNNKSKNSKNIKHICFL